MSNQSTFDESIIENSFAEINKHENPNRITINQIVEESDDQCSAADDIKIPESESSVVLISDNDSDSNIRVPRSARKKTSYWPSPNDTLGEDFRLATSSKFENSTPKACGSFKSKMLHSTPKALDSSVNSSFKTPQQISKRSKKSVSTPKDNEEIEKTWNCDSLMTDSSNKTSKNCSPYKNETLDVPDEDNNEMSVIIATPRNRNRQIILSSDSESDEEFSAKKVVSPKVSIVEIFSSDSDNHHQPLIFSNDAKVEPLDEKEARKLRLILEKSKHIQDMDTEQSDEGDSDSSESSKSSDESDDDSCCVVSENVPTADNDNTTINNGFVKVIDEDGFGQSEPSEEVQQLCKLVLEEYNNPEIRKTQLLVDYVIAKRNHELSYRKLLKIKDSISKTESVSKDEQYQILRNIKIRGKKVKGYIRQLKILQKQLRSHYGVTGKQISKFEQQFNEENPVPDTNPSSDSEFSDVEENMTGKQISKFEQQFNEENPVPDTNPSSDSEFSDLEENMTGKQISKFEQQFNEENPVPDTNPSSDSEFSNVEENVPSCSSKSPEETIMDDKGSTNFPNDDIIDLDSLDDYNPGPSFESVPTNNGDSKAAVQTGSTNFPNDDIIDLDSLDDYNPGPSFKSVPTNNGDSKAAVQTGPPKFNNLPSANIKLSEMGRKALETHRVQQAVTVGALEKLHKSLENFPDKNSLADDPVGLKVSLLPHQKYALNWLLWRETQPPPGGLLADDMGLGKTLTMISLILKSKQTADELDRESSSSRESGSEEDEKPAAFNSKLPVGGTLVICPSSVMGQWETEVRSKIRSGSLSVLLYHGPKREKNVKRIARYDIVLTTYSLVQKNSEGSPLTMIKWNRIILDEGHVIRNHKSQTALAIFNLKRKISWVLTGTPIHNKELDFYSLIKFIKVKPFNDLAVWKRWVDNKDAAGIERLNLITKTIMLRRTKEEIQNEGGLNSLKPKELKLVKVQLDPEEYAVYEKVLHFSRTVLANFIHQRAEKENLLRDGIPINNAKKHFMNFNGDENPFKDHPELGRLHRNMMTMGDKIQSHEILVLLLRLRQICCHPSLATAIVEKEEMAQAGLEDDQGNDAEMMDKMLNLSIAVDPNEEEGTEEKDTNHSILSTENPVFDRTRCSSKIRSVVDHLLDILFNTEDDKIIVVSQWTSVLNILHDVLKQHGIKTVALNGSIPVKDRMPIIEKFNKQGSGPRVLLLSLTAGGTGLNLVGGNHLLLIDIHWNPQLEAQACDRIYRFGQTKQVVIYKFICCDTIEENIEQLQKKKLDLAHGVLTGSMKISSNKLTMSDLKMLFNVQ